jgi:hypothetical protein
MNHVEFVTNRTAQHEQIEKIKREKRVHGGIINRKNVSKVKSQKGKKRSMENKVPPKCEQSEKTKGKNGFDSCSKLTIWCLISSFQTINLKRKCPNKAILIMIHILSINTVKIPIYKSAEESSTLSHIPLLLPDLLIKAFRPSMLLMIKGQKRTLPFLTFPFLLRKTYSASRLLMRKGQLLCLLSSKEDNRTCNHHRTTTLEPKRSPP